MSTIPPNWLGSVLGGSAAQGRAVERQVRDEADAARSADGDFANRLRDLVGSVDRDSGVDPEGGGAGGQGRASQTPEEPSAPQPDDAGPAGPTGVDLQA